MRPIYLGLILFSIGSVGMVLFGLLAGLGGLKLPQPPLGAYGIIALFYFHVALFALSLPIAVAVEVARWAKRRRERGERAKRPR